MADEQIPIFFVHVPDEKSIPKVLEFLKKENQEPPKFTLAKSKVDARPNIPKASGKGVTQGGDIPANTFNSLGSAGDRAKLLIGEINAGNDSDTVKDELCDILHYLRQGGKINSQRCDELLEKYC